MEEEIYRFCLDQYNETYLRTKERLELDAITNSSNHCITSSAAKKIETASQLEAIKTTMIEGRLLYPNNIPLLWASIYKAHLYSKS